MIKHVDSQSLASLKVSVDVDLQKLVNQPPNIRAVRVEVAVDNYHLSVHMVTRLNVYPVGSSSTETFNLLSNIRPRWSYQKVHFSETLAVILVTNHGKVPESSVNVDVLTDAVDQAVEITNRKLTEVHGV